MKKKWIWLLLPAALLLLILLHVHSLARLAPSEIGRQVPVLMYHAVGDDCWGEEHLFVRPAELEQQLQYLSENGYETIFFEDLAHLERYEKPVILTFDDGYDDNYTLLLPLLQKYHMKATIFMIAGDIGGPHKLTQPQLDEAVLRQIDKEIPYHKGTMESLNIKPIERAKISCARKLFNEISTENVKYHDVDNYQHLLDVMKSL